MPRRKHGQLRGLRAALDARREREADITWRPYVRPFGDQGLSYVSRRGADGEVIVANAQGITFGPGTIVPVGSHTGHVGEGEVIIGVPPPQKRAGAPAIKTSKTVEAPVVPAGRPDLLGVSGSPSGTDGVFSVYRHDSEGAVLDAVAVDSQTFPNWLISGGSASGKWETKMVRGGVDPSGSVGTDALMVMASVGGGGYVSHIPIWDWRNGTFYNWPTPTGDPFNWWSGDPGKPNAAWHGGWFFALANMTASPFDTFLYKVRGDGSSETLVKRFNTSPQAIGSLDGCTVDDGISSEDLTGTMSVTAGTDAVTGSGTAFLSEISPGDYLGLASEEIEVATVPSDTSLTLVSNHVGGASGANGVKIAEGSGSTFSLFFSTFSGGLNRLRIDTVTGALSRTTYAGVWNFPNEPNLGGTARGTFFSSRTGSTLFHRIAVPALGPPTSHSWRPEGTGVSPHLVGPTGTAAQIAIHNGDGGEYLASPVTNDEGSGRIVYGPAAPASNADLEFFLPGAARAVFVPLIGG